MPLPRALALGAAALAIFTTAAPAAPVHPRDRAPAQPRCGAPGSSAFPITARLTGGPEMYERGAAPRTWRLELRNSTGAECRGVHPVAVLADRDRTLQPADVRLDFYDDAASRWRPVTLERTEEAENVGVFDGSSPEFEGFTVPARGTVGVRVRLGFTGRAPEGQVTANVTAVQRRTGDGDWVGESNDYTFAIEGTRDPADEVRAGEANTSASPDARPGHRHRGTLADTGSQRPLFAIGAAAFALLLAGGSLLFGARRSQR
ncbi:hypothetical protein [Streptomyces sp. ISL-11]|uniref:hypothetical protein n=1 Tax=Streptomyces sp. ISL-11 TaxID=2819174 RepID=UPI001BE88C86|nr:hypothetical protein [Streptomyces sp. ISL-11]MBT2382670.1 hypothetical protein [Streptomyces sp. ISL-11]